MAAASKKKSTKENDEVKDNAKNAESVFESNTKNRKFKCEKDGKATKYSF